MPENACQHFYRCKGCGDTLKPKRADTVCPPKQAA